MAGALRLRGEGAGGCGSGALGLRKAGGRLLPRWLTRISPQFRLCAPPRCPVWPGPRWLDVLLACWEEKRPQMLDESPGMHPHRRRRAARMCK